LLGTVHNLFQHCNIDVKIGPLNYVFSMAELHRLHHSDDPAESNANYGGHLALWDLVFGTRLWPRKRPAPEHLGLTDLPLFPETLGAQLLSPLHLERYRVAAGQQAR
jgi:sterol desaturase/sphingolipid hydroxylase (fatty acid hydroxylase superfamily)